MNIPKNECIGECRPKIVKMEIIDDKPSPTIRCLSCKRIIKKPKS